MEDSSIIALFWGRDQAAIPAARDKYGGYCHSVVVSILEDLRDAEECLSDTWLAAWNSIPPQRPAILSAFLARITRNLAFNRWQAYRAQKRGGGQIALALEELEDCVSGTDDPAEAVVERELKQALQDFLAALPQKRRVIFLRRYWLVQPVKRIAWELGMLPGAVSMSLTRTRRELRDHLIKRGYDL